MASGDKSMPQPDSFQPCQFLQPYPADHMISLPSRQYQCPCVFSSFWWIMKVIWLGSALSSWQRHPANSESWTSLMACAGLKAIWRKPYVRPSRLASRMCSRINQSYPASTRMASSFAPAHDDSKPRTTARFYPAFFDDHDAWPQVINVRLQSCRICDRMFFWKAFCKIVTKHSRADRSGFRYRLAQNRNGLHCHNSPNEQGG